MNTFVEAIGFGLVTSAIIGLAAVGLSLQVGVTNFINFAYGDVMTLGAYFAYVLNSHGWPILAAAAAAGVGVAVVMVLVNKVVFKPFIVSRSKLITLLIVTLALSFIIQNGIVIIWGAGAYRYNVSTVGVIHLGPIVWSVADVTIMGLAVVLLVALHLGLKRTTYGKALRATSNNADLAAACGINTWSVAAWTWALSGFFAAVAGVGLVAEVETLRPTVGFNELFLIFGAVILGGIGQPYGAMAGAVIIGMVTSIAGAYVPGGYEIAIAFVVLAAVLLLRPQGLFAARGRSA
ncbi:MAG: branched-chain amino acid ABC transporter permease [Candidatus Dormibacteria bacterium]